MYIFSKASNEIYEVNKKTVQNLEKITDGVVSHLSLSGAPTWFGKIVEETSLKGGGEIQG